MPVIHKDAPEEVAWSIGGVPVNFEWGSCSMTAPGGYSDVSGQVTGARQLKRIRQGQTIIGTRANGRILYKGTVVSPPKIVNDTAYVEGEGFQAIVRRHNERLPYLIADASQWSEISSEPFSYSASSKFTLQSQGDLLGWKVAPSETWGSSGLRDGYAIYIPDNGVQRIRATLRKSDNDADWEMAFLGGDDLGAISDVTTKALSVANPDGTALNIHYASTASNTVAIVVRTTGSTTPSTKYHWWLQDVTACVIADDTDFSVSDVVSDVAMRLGFGEEVNTSSIQVETLDWTSGWDELLNYMAAIEDWTWLVIEDTSKQMKPAALVFRPWGHNTWNTSLDLAKENLTVAPLYNRVTVMYERPAGVPHHKTYRPSDFGITDPVPDLEYEFPDSPTLENPQRSTNMVEAIAQRLMRRVTETRLAGTIRVSGLTSGRPFDMKAGDMLNINGYNPAVPPQRISHITYNADGTADVQLERSWDVGAMLFRLSSGGHGRRRRAAAHSWGSGHRS